MIVSSVETFSSISLLHEKSVDILSVFMGFLFLLGRLVQSCKNRFESIGIAEIESENNDCQDDGQYGLAKHSVQNAIVDHHRVRVLGKGFVTVWLECIE